eukprot:GHVU01087417.1.p2 GENE.GHVU01087417.1~~GHVU01087417.1.p2  ORF type:complete len:150 (+),score=8.66 GHVU01087417.1:1073-1522(+)
MHTRRHMHTHVYTHTHSHALTYRHRHAQRSIHTYAAAISPVATANTNQAFIHPSTYIRTSARTDARTHLALAQDVDEVSNELLLHFGARGVGADLLDALDGCVPHLPALRVSCGTPHTHDPSIQPGCTHMQVHTHTCIHGTESKTRRRK